MFPVENRYIDGQLQDFNALSTYISKWESGQFLEAISDFHLLLYLFFMDMLPMKSAMGPLLEAVRTKNYAAALQWKEQEVWSTLETLITASSSASGSVERIKFACCTYNLWFGGLLLICNDIWRLMFVSNYSGMGHYPDTDATSATPDWTCDHCTFINRGALSSCEICNLPRYVYLALCCMFRRIHSSSNWFLPFFWLFQKLIGVMLQLIMH